MRTNSRRGAHALTLVVLTAAVSLSGRVEAQQTGLFPLYPIRRQRVPCDQEDPTYKIYKHQYFGYHPTCWRTFPAGWGCPSSEAPNFERSKKEFPIGGNREEAAPELPPEEDQGAPAPRRPAIPDLPPERPGASPFEDMTNPVPNANPLPRGNAAPGRTQPRTNSPFEDLNPRGASRSPSGSRVPGRNPASLPDDGAPELSAPGGTPAQGSAYHFSRGRRDGESAAGDDRGPLLGLSDSDIVRSDASAPDDSQAETAQASPPATVPAPAAPPRRRIFGNLFSNLGSSWIRR